MGRKRIKVESVNIISFANDFRPERLIALTTSRQEFRNSRCRKVRLVFLWPEKSPMIIDVKHAICKIPHLSRQKR